MTRKLKAKSRRGAKSPQKLPSKARKLLYAQSDSQDGRAGNLRAIIDASQGRVPCDLILKNAKFLDVFSCQWRSGDLAIFGGRMVGVGDGSSCGLSGKQTLDLKGKTIVPGFLDAHVHIESSMMLPRAFERSVLGCGTTTAICDPHELANVMGPSGVEYFLDSAQHELSLDLWVMLSSCVPATDMETNGGGEIKASVLKKLAKHPRALGLAEMMNVPGVLNCDSGVMDKLDAFSGGIVDGHCPLLHGKMLSGYAAAGITSCHESSELEEAREKLSKGLAIWIREGSVAKDLQTVGPLLNLATSTSIGFCTDDRNPLDILNEGHIDHLVRGAIGLGIPPEVVYRSASFSVARHYGLHRGPMRVGAVAPGYQADLVVLDDVRSCEIHSVWKRGLRVEKDGGIDLEKTQGVPKALPEILPRMLMKNSIRASIPEPADLVGPSGRVHIIGVVERKIITTHEIGNSTDHGVSRLSVLERYGRGSKPANGYVKGFGKLRGAIASSVGHDSHNLIVVGSDPSEMRTALAALARVGGGFCVVQNGSVLKQLDLPVGGLMADRSPRQLSSDLQALHQASRSIGCELHEPFLQLAFLSLPVIPSLKLTDRGLVDVDQFKIIDVRA